MHSVETAVYRVAAGPDDRWNVYQDPLDEPVASFQDKGLALSYAMGLARGKVSWDLLPGGSVESVRNRSADAHRRAQHA